MNRDYNNYDYLSVSVKSEQLDRILSCYKALGWRVVKWEDDRQYYNMKFVALRRPHAMEHKDRLQYLQVRMETTINRLSTVIFKKHAGSNVLFAFLGLCALALALTGLSLYIVFGADGTGFVSMISCCSVAAAFVLCALVTVPLLRRREEKESKIKTVEKLRLLKELIDEAHTLAPAYGGGNDAAEVEQ